MTLGFRIFPSRSKDLPGCHEYSVPAEIKEHIDLIRPTVHFNHRPSPQSETKFKRAGGLGQPSSGVGPKQKPAQPVPIPATAVPPGLIECDEMITPGCLRALYNVPTFNPAAADKNSYGIGN